MLPWQIFPLKFFVLLQFYKNLQGSVAWKLETKWKCAAGGWNWVEIIKMLQMAHLWSKASTFLKRKCFAFDVQDCAIAAWDISCGTLMSKALHSTCRELQLLLKGFKSSVHTKYPFLNMGELIRPVPSYFSPSVFCLFVSFFFSSLSTMPNPVWWWWWLQSYSFVVHHLHLCTGRPWPMWPLTLTHAVLKIYYLHPTPMTPLTRAPREGQGPSMEYFQV